MKLKSLVLTLSLLNLLTISGCASTPETVIKTEKVMVSQAGDSKLTCLELEPKLLEIETEVQQTLVEKQKRTNKTFAMTSVIDMTLALLAGNASAGNRVDRSMLEDFSQPELARMNSLAERHNHLLLLSKDKQCGFVPEVEARIAKYKTQSPSMTPALDDQSYRKRPNAN